MLTILNTSNARNRDEALNTIIKNMNKSMLYKPVAYMLDQSGCSCCRSEYFYLICKIKNEYKVLCYNGHVKHTNNCAITRCLCDESFIWKNIKPTEEKCKDFKSILESFVSINDDIWKDDYINFLEQQQENKDIYEYNEDNEDDKLNKNHDFYFKID